MIKMMFIFRIVFLTVIRNCRLQSTDYWRTLKTWWLKRCYVKVYQDWMYLYWQWLIC